MSQAVPETAASWNLSSMPRYVCHKEVRALKILDIQHDRRPQFTKATCKGCFALGSGCGHCERCAWERDTGGRLGATIVADDAPAEYPNARTRFRVSAEYLAKHKPTSGGYYVVYKDGYESFSPAQAFEEGYTLQVEYKHFNDR